MLTIPQDSTYHSICYTSHVSTKKDGSGTPELYAFPNNVLCVLNYMLGSNY